MAESKPNMMRRFDLVGSMKQSTNPFLMEDTEFTYLRNVAHDEIGSLSKDGGYSQYGADLNSTGSVNMLAVYDPGTGTRTPVAIVNGDVLSADATPAWTEIDSGPFTADVDSTWANFLGRLYVSNGVEGICYTTGGEVASISTDNGGVEVKAKYILTLNDSLYAANLTETYGSNDIVYTVPGSHTFFNVGEENHDTFATTSYKTAITEPITGIYAYQGALIVFSEDEMYVWNPSNQEMKTIANIGCSSIKTIREINGVLYWTNREGIFRFNGETLPELISIPITNWAINSLWRLINGLNWSTMAAWQFEGKYFLSVGDLTAIMPGDDAALTGVVIVYDTYRDVWYFLDGYGTISHAVRFINADGNLRLLMGSGTDKEVYQKDYTYTHKGSAITMAVRTKYFNFENPEAEKVLKDLYVTYRPEGQSSKYLVVKTAINGTNLYEEKIGAATATRLELDGVTGTEFQQERVAMGGDRARTVSYEFSNADSGVNVTLLGYSQEFDYKDNNKNYSS